MSIALGIIDLATGQARQQQAQKIIEVELDIGTISGVEIPALNFALEVAVKETLLETARIKINRIEARSKCLGCGELFTPEQYLSQCPRCRTLNTQVLQGREMQVKSLLIE
ncbi:MAG: hydrogenase maturation nickel metallochaperone HypA [Bacteroidota bacterium]